MTEKTASKKATSTKTTSAKTTSKKVASEQAAKKTAAKRTAAKKASTTAAAKPKPRPLDEREIVLFPSQADWDTWLAAHHAASDGVWLRLAKKGADFTTLSYAEAVEVALCWGWIDGQKRKHDDASWLQAFAPRRPRSVWSKINVEKVEALVAAGRMQPAGLAQVEAAKADGRWDAAYDAQSRATVPDDLAAALADDPKAAAFFETLSKANRYAILHRLQTAAKPETRARRLERFLEMLRRGETLH